MEYDLSIQQIINEISINQENQLIFISENQLRIKVQKLSKEQVLNRYFQYSSKQWIQDGKKRNWTLDQIQLLIYITDKVCYYFQKSIELLTKKQWKIISSAFPMRNEQDCMFKMLNARKYSLSQFPWTKLEDQYFKQLIQQYGYDWNKVSRQLYYKNQVKVYRNTKACKQHFSCFLDPNNKKGHWSHQQDYNLALLYLRMGRKWSKIAKEVQGRNQNSIKNRFFLMFQSYKQKKINNKEEVQQRVRKYINDYQNQHEHSKSQKTSQQKCQIKIQQQKMCINSTSVQNSQISIIKQGCKQDVEDHNFMHEDALNFLSYFNQSNYFNCLDI